MSLFGVRALIGLTKEACLTAFEDWCKKRDAEDEARYSLKGRTVWVVWTWQSSGTDQVFFNMYADPVEAQEQAHKLEQNPKINSRSEPRRIQ